MTEIFIQWKATDVFGDFYCECGNQSNFGGYGAYRLKCCDCGRVYKMPTNFILQEVDDEDVNYMETFE